MTSACTAPSAGTTPLIGWRRNGSGSTGLLASPSSSSRSHAGSRAPRWAKYPASPGHPFDVYHNFVVIHKKMGDTRVNTRNFDVIKNVRSYTLNQCLGILRHQSDHPINSRAVRGMDFGPNKRPAQTERELRFPSWCLGEPIPSSVQCLVSVVSSFRAQSKGRKPECFPFALNVSTPCPSSIASSLSC